VKSFPGEAYILGSKFNSVSFGNISLIKGNDLYDEVMILLNTMKK
jgi:hypothetical protein